MHVGDFAVDDLRRELARPFMELTEEAEDFVSEPMPPPRARDRRSRHERREARQLAIVLEEQTDPSKLLLDDGQCIGCDLHGLAVPATMRRRSSRSISGGATNRPSG